MGPLIQDVGPSRTTAATPLSFHNHVHTEYFFSYEGTQSPPKQHTATPAISLLGITGGLHSRKFCKRFAFFKNRDFFTLDSADPFANSFCFPSKNDIMPIFGYFHGTPTLFHSTASRTKILPSKACQTWYTNFYFPHFRTLQM